MKLSQHHRVCPLGVFGNMVPKNTRCRFFFFNHAVQLLQHHLVDPRGATQTPLPVAQPGALTLRFTCCSSTSRPHPTALNVQIDAVLPSNPACPTCDSPFQSIQHTVSPAFGGLENSRLFEPCCHATFQATRSFRYNIRDQVGR